LTDFRFTRFPFRLTSSELIRLSAIERDIQQLTKIKYELCFVLEEFMAANIEHSVILREGNENMELGLALATIKFQVQEEMRRRRYNDES